MLFELENNTVKFSPITLTIKEFKKLWSRDRTVEKKQAVAELSYIFFLIDYKSIYRSYDEEERKQRIIEDLVDGSKININDPDLIVAIEKYKELIVTPSIALLDDAECAIFKIRKYFREVDLTQMDDKGKPIYTARDLMANIKSVGDVAESLRKTREQVEKEQNELGRIMGNETIAIFEDPKMR